MRKDVHANPEAVRRLTERFQALIQSLPEGGPSAEVELLEILSEASVLSQHRLCVSVSMLLAQSMAWRGEFDPAHAALAKGALYASRAKSMIMVAEVRGLAARLHFMAGNLTAGTHAAVDALSNEKTLEIDLGLRPALWADLAWICLCMGQYESVDPCLALAAGAMARRPAPTSRHQLAHHLAIALCHLFRHVWSDAEFSSRLRPLRADPPQRRAWLVQCAAEVERAAGLADSAEQKWIAMSRAVIQALQADTSEGRTALLQALRLLGPLDTYFNRSLGYVAAVLLLRQAELQQAQAVLRSIMAFHGTHAEPLASEFKHLGGLIEEQRGNPAAALKCYRDYALEAVSLLLSHEWPVRERMTTLLARSRAEPMAPRTTGPTTSPERSA